MMILSQGLELFYFGEGNPAGSLNGENYPGNHFHLPPFATSTISSSIGLFLRNPSLLRNYFQLITFSESLFYVCNLFRSFREFPHFFEFLVISVNLMATFPSSDLATLKFPQIALDRQTPSFPLRSVLAEIFVLVSKLLRTNI